MNFRVLNMRQQVLYNLRSLRYILGRKTENFQLLTSDMRIAARIVCYGLGSQMDVAVNFDIIALAGYCVDEEVEAIFGDFVLRDVV